MGGEGFKTILSFIKICSFELEFYTTLPLPMLSQDIVEFIKFLRIPRARMFYTLPSYRDSLRLPKVPMRNQEAMVTEWGDTFSYHKKEQAEDIEMPSTMKNIVELTLTSREMKVETPYRDMGESADLLSLYAGEKGKLWTPFHTVGPPVY